MNRKIKNELKTIRAACKAIEGYCRDCATLEPIVEEESSEELINWTTADEPVKTYLKDLKDMTILPKDYVILGQIKTLFELKSYVKPSGEGAGLVYRIVLEDETSDITVIAFDKKAEELRQYTVGQCLRITGAWKVQENKHGKRELHIGNFAKIEVVE